MADTYTLPIFLYDALGQPAVDADATIQVIDEDTNERLDFSDGTWKETPVTSSVNMTNGTGGRYYYTFTVSEWGTRRVHFLIIANISGELRQIDRVEYFRFGGYVPQSQVTPPFYGYVTVEECREWGIDEEMCPSDAKLELLIKDASLQIDLYCGQWFNLRTLTLPVKYKGNSRYIYLPTMLVNLTSIVNEVGGEELELTDATLYNQMPEDYQDPRVVFQANIGSSPKVFLISGDWGVVEDEEGTILQSIKTATLLTVAMLLGYSTVNFEDDSMRQFIVMETTDRHQYTLSTGLMGASRGRPTILPMAARMILEPFIRPVMM